MLRLRVELYDKRWICFKQQLDQEWGRSVKGADGARGPDQKEELGANRFKLASSYM